MCLLRLIADESSVFWFFERFSFIYFEIIYFALYWILIMPSIFVMLFYDCFELDDIVCSQMWPIVFWIIALIFFIVTSFIISVFWIREEMNTSIKLLVPIAKDFAYEPKESYKTIDEITSDESNSPFELIPLKVDEDVEVRLNKSITNLKDHRHTEYPKKADSELNIRRVSLYDIAKLESPKSPRELFFKDLIETANSLEASKIPETEKLLENGQKSCEVINEIQKTDNENEFYLGIVPVFKNECSKITMYISGETECGETEYDEPEEESDKYYF